MSATVQGCDAKYQSRLEAKLQLLATSTPQRLHSPSVVTAKSYETDVGVFVTKSHSPERASEGTEQCEAECRAAEVLKAACGGPCPLLSTPAATEQTPDGAVHYAYVYAGKCVMAKLRAGEWVHLTASEREQLCKTMAVCLLKTVAIYQAVPCGPHAHRDIKLDNICVYEVEGAGRLFVLIDHGGFCPTSGEGFFPLFDLRYLDNTQAAMTEDGYYVIDDEEAMEVNTHLPTIDLRQTGTAVVELYCGGLPAQVDASKYDLSKPEEMAKFLQWASSWPWDKWLAREVQRGRMPAAMADFLLRCMHQNWEERTSSATELLQHPWLAGEVAAVDATVAAAAPAWAAQHAALDALLAGSSAASSEQDVASHSRDAWGSSNCASSTTCSSITCSSSSIVCAVKMQAGAAAALAAVARSSCSSEADVSAAVPDACCCTVHLAAAGAQPKGSSSSSDKVCDKVCVTASEQQPQQVAEPLLLEAVTPTLGCFPWLTVGSSSSSSNSSDACCRLAQKCAKAIKKKASRVTQRVAKAFKACTAVFG